jgi:hypothetical protein
MWTPILVMRMRAPLLAAVRYGPAHATLDTHQPPSVQSSTMPLSSSHIQSMGLTIIAAFHIRLTSLLDIALQCSPAY